MAHPQCGLTSSGLEVLTHSVTALLEAHPDWVDAAVDFRNAFNALHRREFFSVVESSFPDLLPWVSTMYSCPTELFYRLDDSTSATIESRCGTRQGCPLGAQLFALGLHPRWFIQWRASIIQNYTVCIRQVSLYSFIQSRYTEPLYM